MTGTRSTCLRALAFAVIAGATLLSPTAAHAVVVERIVAIVGDKPILLSELRARARPFVAQAAARVPAGAQRTAAESQILRDMLEKMIEEELERDASDKAHIVVTPDEIDNALKQSAASQGVTVAAMYQEARGKGLTDQEFRDEIRRQVLEGKLLLLRVKGRVRITEEDVKSMFERMVREERRRRDYHPAWIILRIPPGSSAGAVAERRALADSLAARARRGEDFATLAQQFSDDTATRDKGGDLGLRAPQGSPAAMTGKRPVMAPELEAVVLPLEPNDVAPPMMLGAEAIAVVKLVSRQPSRYTTLEEAKPEMIQRLQVDILEKAKKKWLDDLRRRTHLDVRL